MDLIEDRGDQTLWMNANRFSRIEFDTGRAVATPIMLQEDEGTAKDFGFEQQHREQNNELKSIGFNAEWQVSDHFIAGPRRARLEGGELAERSASRAAARRCSASRRACRAPATRATRTSAPIASSRRSSSTTACRSRSARCSANPTSACPGSGGDPNFAFTPDHLGSQYLRVNYQEQTSDITQARIDGNLEFDERTSPRPVRRRDARHGIAATRLQRTDDPGRLGRRASRRVAQQICCSRSAWSSQFEDFGTAGVPRSGWKGNANALAQWAVRNLRRLARCQPDQWRAGLQPGLRSGPHGRGRHRRRIRPIRHERRSWLACPPTCWWACVTRQTDVEAVSNQLVPPRLIWQDNNDFSELARPDPGGTLKEEADYDHVLPNFDFDIEVVRQREGALLLQQDHRPRAVQPTARGRGRRRLARLDASTAFAPTATGSNTQLDAAGIGQHRPVAGVVLRASSYVSAGFFHKNVENFIGNEVGAGGACSASPTRPPARARRRPGPRCRHAASRTDDTNLFVMMAMIENPARHRRRWQLVDRRRRQRSTAPKRSTWRSPRGTTLLTRPPTDPVYQFNVTRPVNNKRCEDPWLGAGWPALLRRERASASRPNYTIVKGDVAFNNGRRSVSINQFALLGLSDSANAGADVREVRLPGAPGLQLARRVSCATPTAATIAIRSTSRRTTRST